MTVSSDTLTLDVLPELGASVLNLRAASGRPVLRAVNPAAVTSSSDAASFTLLPFSNRVRDARFTFGGHEVTLRPTTPDGGTQHGDVRGRPWTVTRVDGAHLHCTFHSRDFEDMNWPWPFTAQVEYVLRGPHLDTSVTLTNAGTDDMPAGMDLHPYFTRRHGGVDPLVSFGAELTYDTDAKVIPTAARPVTPHEDHRAPTPLDTDTVNRVYTAWDGVARLD